MAGAYAPLLAGVHPEWAKLVGGDPALVDALRVGLLAGFRSQEQGETVVPPIPQVFEALRYFPPTATKVVVVGQDPYHTVVPRRRFPGGAGGGPPGGGGLEMLPQAHGLSFSCNPELNMVQPSLHNIFKAATRDVARETGLGLAELAKSAPPAACLQFWAAQGVLLLNRALTTVAKRAGAHLKDWDKFTRLLLAALVQACLPGGKLPVFMLWGRPAQQLAPALRQAGVPDSHILEWTHPSPLNNGLPPDRHFTSCGHFFEANRLLAARGDARVEWLSICIVAAADGACKANGAKHAKAGYGFVCKHGLQGLATAAGPVRDGEYRFVDPANPLAGIAPVLPAAGGKRVAPTNNRGEYLAFCYLMLHIARMRQAAPVVVVLDSKLLIDTLEAWLPGWRKKGTLHEKKNVDLVLIADELLQLARRSAKVNLVHIRSHRAPPPVEDTQNHLYWSLNDQADRLAGQGENLPAMVQHNTWFPHPGA